MQNEILTVKDLNRYLPAIKTNEDMAFTNKLHEGLFLADPIDGLENIPDESIDLIITEPTMQPKSNSLSGKSPTFENYVDWVDGWLEESKRVLTPNGSIYIICPWQSSSMYHSVLEKKFNIQSRINIRVYICNNKNFKINNFILIDFRWKQNFINRNILNWLRISDT